MSTLPKTTPSTPLPPGHHLAAISSAAGHPLQLTHRPTPTPGPTELLIAVHAVALNPIDYYQRDRAIPPITHYPAVLGSDISGTVLAAGTDVPADAPKPGSRIAAFCPTFFVQGEADYGAMQGRALVPAANAVPLPESMGYEAAALLPMAVVTAWTGLFRLGVGRDTALRPGDKKGFLVWGGASSIGSGVLQVVRGMGFVVYVTASEKHHAYMKELGASKVFDYKEEGVVTRIVEEAKRDGVRLNMGYDAVGQLGPCLDVLKEFREEGNEGVKLTTVKHLTKDSPKVEGIEVSFVAPVTDPEERNEFFHFIFMEWLKKRLETGEYVPSPKIKIIDGGLESVNEALDELKAGVSGTKLVLQL